MTTADELAAAQKAWSRTLDDLQGQMTRATYNTWLRGSQVVAQDEDRLTIAVRHGYALDWIQGRLLPVIQRTVHRVVDPKTTVEFVLAVPPGEAVTAEPARSPGKEPGRGEGGDSEPLVWTDFYIKFKIAFRQKALRVLRGAKLSVFLCLALRVNRDGVAHPGIQAIMRETGYSRAAVCSALGELETLGLIAKLACRRGTNRYTIQGYAWFGSQAAPSLWEEVRDDTVQ